MNKMIKTLILLLLLTMTTGCEGASEVPGENRVDYIVKGSTRFIGKVDSTRFVMGTATLTSGYAIKINDCEIFISGHCRFTKGDDVFEYYTSWTKEPQYSKWKVKAV